MAKRKRSRNIDPKPPAPEAAPPVLAGSAHLPQGGLSPADPTGLACPNADDPGDRTCPACALILPGQARYCAACGEPLRPGLTRPTPPQGDERSAQAAEASLPQPPSPSPVVSVPSVARVGLPKSRGATTIPSLSTNRPIPASLLSSGEERGGPNPLGLPRAPLQRLPVTAPTTLPREPAPLPPLPPLQATPAASQEPASPAPRVAVVFPPRVVPLFDPTTEVRLATLRTEHQRNLELLSRLAIAVQPRPTKAAKAAASGGTPGGGKGGDQKGGPKGEKKPDKKADKKAAKGH